MYKVVEMYVKKYVIKIFSTRNRLLVSKWVIDNGLENFIEDITNVKEPCWVYIDDRCINFNGKFDGLIEKIEKFKPYYK